MHIDLAYIRCYSTSQCSAVIIPVELTLVTHCLRIHLVESCFYFTPGSGAKYCDQYVCLSVRSNISETIRSNFTQFCARCLCPCLGQSVLIWRRCDTLCSSGFVDKVMFCVIGLYAFLSSETVTSETAALIPTKFCWTIKISKCTPLLAHRGRSLLSTIALLLIFSKHCLTFASLQRYVFYE